MCPQSCSTLCNCMDYSLPGSSVHEIFQVRILEWVAISFSRGSSWLKGQTGISWVFCIGRQILYHWHHLGNPYTMKSKVVPKSGKKKKKERNEIRVQVGYWPNGNQFENKLWRSGKSLLLGGSLELGLCCIILLSFIRSYRNKYQFKSWILHVRSIYFGIYRYTLIYFKWITNKDLLHSTRNSVQCYVATWIGGKFGGEWLHVYVWLSCSAVHLKLPQHC